jgi:hypothetical protein
VVERGAHNLSVAGSIPAEPRIVCLSAVLKTRELIINSRVAVIKTAFNPPVYLLPIEEA